MAIKEETRLKMRLAKLGKKGNNFGKYWKIKDTSKMNKDKIGKKRPPFSEETKRKMSKSQSGRKLPEVTRMKMGLSRTGIKSPRWIKDRSLIKHQDDRNNPEYKQWRINVYKRDNYKCRINDCNCNGRIIAHHILGFTHYPELRYSINNGITLCQFHHPKKRNDEVKLIQTFTGLVMQTN